MKKIINFILPLILIYFIAGSCDKIDEPYTRGTVIDTDTLVTVKRNILIEDFTGHKCPNCPSAAVIAKDIQAAHPDQIFLLAVHSGSFSNPDGTGLFTYDFRTTTGTELNNYFQIELSGYPSGMISRVQNTVNMKYAIDPDNWQATVDTLIDDEPFVSLELSKTYNTSTNTSTINIETEFLKDTTGTYFLTVYLSEDSIIKPQKNNDPSVGTTPVINNYVHMHVLRAAYNGTWGSQISTLSSFTEGQKFNNTYYLEITGDWVAKNCHALAFLYNDNNKEIVQVAEIAIK